MRTAFTMSVMRVVVQRSLSQVPMAIAVDPDPVRAAAEVQERLLSHYERPVWRVRVRALTDAADGIVQASAKWDTVVDSSRDTVGWTIDTAGYNDTKAARNAVAWQHVEIFLAHGHEVFALSGLPEPAGSGGAASAKGKTPGHGE